ncbi:MAG: hypothetical protein M3157_01555 [Actinomycetota bacterium]|nr:hypothetical protein [Actinomycetota bacterium]
MRQSIILLMVMAIALVLGSGVALAAVKFGTEGRDALIGTNAKDVLYGKGGNDGLAGRGADDVLYGGDGSDFMYGGYVTVGCGDIDPHTPCMYDRLSNPSGGT